MTASQTRFAQRAGATAVLAIAAVLLHLRSVCHAHPAQIVAAHATVNPDGRFQVTARLDLLAYVLNDVPARVDDEPMNALLDGPPDVLAAQLAQATERLQRGVTVIGDVATVRCEAAQLPTVVDVHRWRDSGIRPRLPVIQEVNVEGRLPAGTTRVAFRFPEAMGPIVLTVDRPGEEPYAEPVEAGHNSSSLSITLTQLGGASASPDASSSMPQPPPSAIAPAPTIGADAPDRPGGLHVAWRYLALGFTHILPAGPDHVLFVLGLFLLGGARLRPLLWQVTAFTLAHSITLALALYGVVRAPPALVEPLIAASIAFVAVENLVTSDLKPWRPAVVFGFGLVHGLGFAGVLSDLGLPRHQFATALLTFNVGVELGQLAVLGLAFAVVGWWRRRTWYRRGIVFPASGAIAAVAVFWTVSRIWT